MVIKDDTLANLHHPTTFQFFYFQKAFLQPKKHPFRIIWCLSYSIGKELKPNWIQTQHLLSNNELFFIPMVCTRPHWKDLRHMKSEQSIPPHWKIFALLQSEVNTVYQ